MKLLRTVWRELKTASGRIWAKQRGRRISVAVLIAILAWAAYAFGYPAFFRWYTGDKVFKVTFANSTKVTDGDFEEIARQIQQDHAMPSAEKLTADIQDPTEREDRVRLYLRTRSFVERDRFNHIDIFRKNGVRQYDGPETCLKCHPTMRVQTEDGYVTRDTMDDVLDNAHFRLFASQDGFSTYGYNGEKVDSGLYKIPVGKIDRACGIPGSFTWTGWADIVEAHPEGSGKQTRSVGCGQCHIGGMYGPPSEAMMPGLPTPKESRNSIDCLICHSTTYDMNQRYVIDDGHGKRWNQDRSMKAAMGVTKPESEMCLRCHQHNLGGDVYYTTQNPNELGYANQRLLHTASKRGTPYGPDWDVHAAAGVDCLDCHTAQGHKIARGKNGTDLVANDLPNVEVSCERCHTSAPHVKNTKTRAILNGHVARIACETCHITKLHPSNLVLVDWTNPVYNKEEGVWEPDIVKQDGDIRQAVEYLWFNGNGSFLANALGANPNLSNTYDPFMVQLAGYQKDPSLQLAGLPEGNMFTSQLSPDMLNKRQAMLEQNLRNVMNMGQSKIYPFKLFNARMFEDMNNQGPFGAMILPFDYKIFYEQGKPLESVLKAIEHPIVKRMYQSMFKYYMMDKFMAYFGVGTWSMKYPLDPENRKAIEPHWMRQMGTLMVNHAIQEKGLSCKTCHAENGLIDFRKLGYSDARAKELENPPELKEFNFGEENMTNMAPARTSALTQAATER